MPRNPDQLQAERERAARAHLLARGADRPPARPFATDLARSAVTRRGGLDSTPDDLLAALTLLPAARAELDELEAGLLFAARGAGLTWAQMAAAMGLASPQAVQQRFGRRTS